MNQYNLVQINQIYLILAHHSLYKIKQLLNQLLKK